jgi:hypothetical protein
MMGRAIATLRGILARWADRTHDRHCPCGVQPEPPDDYDGDTVASKVIVPDAG